jgi:hypothetical protein
MKLIKLAGVGLASIALTGLAFLGISSATGATGNVPLPEPVASAPAAPAIACSDVSNDNIPVVTIEKNAPWDQILLSSRQLNNNVWGAHEDEKLYSGIYKGEGSAFGWFWDRPEPKLKAGISFLQPIYPSVRIGGSPWDKSNSSAFPIKVRDVDTFITTVSYTYPQAPAGNYDLAYDFFLLDTDQPSATPKIKAEVMVWLDGSAKQPANSYKGEFSDGYNRFGKYSWTMADGRQYYSFLIKEKSQNRVLHSVDMKRILDSLKFNPDWYIPGIELGSEVWQGTGKIEIGSLDVYMNNNPPLTPAP